MDGLWSSAWLRWTGRGERRVPRVWAGRVYDAGAGAGDERHAAGRCHLVDERVEVRPSAGVEREGDELHPGHRRAAGAPRYRRRRVVAPVEVDPEVGAVGRLETGKAGHLRRHRDGRWRDAWLHRRLNRCGRWRLRRRRAAGSQQRREPEKGGDPMHHAMLAGAVRRPNGPMGPGGSAPARRPRPVLSASRRLGARAPAAPPQRRVSPPPPRRAGRGTASRRAG